MKAVKIILAVAVVAVIGFFVWKWIGGIGDPIIVEPPRNQFIERIEGKIDSLRNAPVNVFSTTLRDQITFDITAFHRQSFLGQSESDNNQWKEILSRNLFSAYASKFVEQAMHVFRGSEWRVTDLTFIRNEIRDLKASEHFDPSSTVFSRELEPILAKHDEITNFIAASNNFSFTDFELSARFPDVSVRVNQSRAYLRSFNSSSHNSDIPYGFVRNATRLTSGLSAIPQNLFNKHTAYLRTKIERHGGRFREFDSQADFSNAVITPLRNQLNALSNDVYGIDANAFRTAHNELDRLLSARNSQAMTYFIELELRRQRELAPTPTPIVTTPPATQPQSPTADIRNVRVEFNVYQNNVRGMRIYVTFGVQNMQGRTGNSAVWFSFSDGRQVMGRSSQHRTGDGQATVQRRITPTYLNSVWTDLAFFMPYSELDAPSGRHDLRFHVGIIDDNRNHIATSGFTNFQFTR